MAKSLQSQENLTQEMVSRIVNCIAQALDAYADHYTRNLAQ
jgi:hypothetical protein